MTRALITGITGQDGTYLSRDLIERGYEVHGLVRPGDRAAPTEGVTFHSGDIRDASRLCDLVLQVRPTEIYNLAGQTSVAASWEDPTATAEMTGSAVAAILSAVRSLDADVRFVQASSAEIFGTAPAPQSESTPIAPVNPYGAAKAFGHFLVGAFRNQGLHASSLVLFNHESPLRPPTFVTRKITSTVARISCGLETTLTLGSLDLLRDWGWAPDYVRAMQLAAGAPQGGDFVIGTGEIHSIGDFVEAAFAAVGIADWRPLVATDPAFVRATDSPVQQADASKAMRELGWQHTATFDEIVARMVAADLALLDA